MTTPATELPPRRRIGSLPVPHWRLWATMGIVLAVDQSSKWWVVERSGFTLGLYPPFGGRELLPGFFNLVYAVNYGAAWGMFEGFSLVLVGLAIVVLALIASFHRQLGLAQPGQQWVFGLIVGGIVGNTIDRLARGHVVDFLDFHLPWYRWPTFNFADCAIVAGTLWYLVQQLRPQPRKPSTGPNPT